MKQVKKDSKNEERNSITIFINRHEKDVMKRTITYLEVILLAFGEHVENDKVMYTIMYGDGPKQNQSGSMVIGDHVKITEGMWFNVKSTNRS